MYRTMSDWLNEIENYGLRAERVPAGAMPWIETAWQLGAEAALRAQWLPIETAPKEGDEILMLDAEGSRWLGYWVSGEGDDGRAGWTEDGTGHMPGNVTHWRPLPAPLEAPPPPLSQDTRTAES